MDQYPLTEGGLFGAASFVVGYLATYVLLVADLEGLSGGVEDISWEGAGMMFYNAQFVRLSTGGDRTINSLAQLGRLSDTFPTLAEPSVYDSGILTLPTLTYTLLVALVLVVAGYLVAEQTATPHSSVTEHMEAGMTIAVGYLPLAVLGTFVFEEDSIVGGETISPDLFAGALVAGVLFPLVFGAIGGYLSKRR